MSLEIAKLHNRMKATTVYVTHDQVEAMTLAYRVVVMNAGVVETDRQAFGSLPQTSEPFRCPLPRQSHLNTFVASWAEANRLSLLGRSIDVAAVAGERSVATSVTFGIRPEDLVACSPEDAWFSGEVAVAERLGSQTYAYVEIGEVSDGLLESAYLDDSESVPAPCPRGGGRTAGPGQPVSGASA
ncbi:TOBE domain-containing protein [Rhizobium sullae]|uniref:TOBE domain-containing protein n=1 Tax=Rhizobium sullae TaxID=50338 RepID=UPI00313C57AA